MEFKFFKISIYYSSKGEKMKNKIRSYYKKHPDRSAIIVLVLTFITIVSIIILFAGQGGIWGSEKDWKSQHFAIPEYFRMRFHETHDPFPDLALQLGGGQNIYNYAYYGIFNPLYLPSYIMPFVRMSTYLQVLSLLTVIVSSIMSYYFFKRHFKPGISLILAVTFMISGGLMFHSHRHIMFMNYFPFLLTMLFCCGNKNSTKNNFIMALMAYCIMCASFYYSVGCFVCIGAYMIYLELSKNEKFSIKNTLKEHGCKVLSSAFGCLASAFLWIPVFSALLSGRAETNQTLSWTEILLPTVNLSLVLHTGYSIGVTSVAVFAALFILCRGKKQDKFLSVLFLSCAVFPVINYAINAGMYIDGKAFIPLIPLALIVLGKFFENENKSGNIIKVICIIYILMPVISIAMNNHTLPVTVMILCDYIVSIPVMLFLLFRKNGRWIPVYSIILTVGMCIGLNMYEKFVPRESIDEFYNQDTRNAVTDILESDDELYRFCDCIPNDINVNRVISMEYLSTNSYSSVSNSALREFRFKSSLSENRVRNTAVQNQPYNILFSVLMGCRYKIAPEKLRMFGDEPVGTDGNYTIYRQKYAFPLGYATNSVMNEKDFHKLPSHLKAEALLENIIIPEHGTETAPHLTKEIKINMKEALKDKRLSCKNGVYTIKSDTPFKVKAPLAEEVKDKLLIVTVSADNRIGKLSAQKDIAVTINGVKNKLTDPNWKYNNRNYDFTYVISSYEPVRELSFTFTKGYYTLSDMHVYTLDSKALTDAMDNKDEYHIDRKNSLGDTITGNINVRKDGWFTLSLPYDKGYHITIDGNDTDYFQTNTAFIGFPIKAGEHDIDITFEAPFKKTGLKVSLASVIALILFLTGYTFLGKKSSNADQKK